MPDKDLRVALREAMRSAVVGALVGTPYEGTPVVYRPTRTLISVPSVTFWDTGEKADDVVPLYQRLWHFDIWTTLDLDDAEAIAHLMNSVLDHQPVSLPGDEGLIAFLMLQSDQDQPQEDADFVRKMLTYRMLVYEYNGPGPFGVPFEVAP